MTGSHLSPETEIKLAWSDAERIIDVQTDKWIGYGRATEVLDELKGLLNHPKIYRMPNLFLVGRTNSGKTQILRRFAELNPANDNVGGEAATVPVLYVQTPPSPDEKRIYINILKRLFAKFSESDSVGRLEANVQDKFAKIGLKMLIVDELNSLVIATPRSQQKFLTVLKYLCNELQIVIVTSGTEDAIRVIHTDPQLTNRFTPVTIPRWKLSKEYQRFLASYEQVTPLRNPSGLSKQQMAQAIWSRTDGTIGEAILLLKKAAEHAILRGLECIDIDVLDQCGFVRPSYNRKTKFDT